MHRSEVCVIISMLMSVFDLKSNCTVLFFRFAIALCVFVKCLMIFMHHDKQMHEVIPLDYSREITVFHKFSGRLGNQLFQYAAIVGISKLYGARACFDHNPLGDYFQLEKDLCVRPIPMNSTYLDDKQHYATYQPFTIEGNTVITGDLQSYRYFEKTATLRDVRIHHRFTSEARVLLSRVLSVTLHPVRVAIHVRKLHRMHEEFFIRFFGNPLPEDYAYLRFPTPRFFEVAMGVFRQMYPGCVFIVLSDSPKWCAEQPFLQGTDMHIIETRNTPILDLAMIAECDHVILTRGTFGWWGAFLGAHARGGHVIYNSDEFDMSHHMNANHVTVTDFYPPSWLPISGNLHIHNMTQSFR